MAELTVQRISLTGAAPTFSGASVTGDTFVNNGDSYLHVKNGGAGAVTVTVDAKKSCNHGFDHDAVVSVPAGLERQIGPFPLDRFNDENRKVSVSYSGVTSVTVAVIKL